jgi:hypothetical protein
MTMTMTTVNFGLFFLALPALLLQGVQVEAQLRHVSVSNVDRKLTATATATHGYDESLGKCNGATCGLYGDPHMLTCDGRAYDCQGLGLFTLMKNHMYNIQANFVDVSAHEHDLVKDWGWTQGASLTNDVMIDFVLEDCSFSAPVLQLGFGNLNKRADGKFPSEDGCEPMKYYFPNLPSFAMTTEANLMQCRQRCDDTPGCTKFVFWYNGHCFLNDEGHGQQQILDTPVAWGRSLAGTMASNCGKKPEEMLIEEKEQRMKHGMIGSHCPLLFFVDGQMVDLSDKAGSNRNGYIYGNATTDVSVEIKEWYKVEITYKLDNSENPDVEETAEILLIAKGDGPGELWSCHWDLYVCLPESQQELFMDYSIGLLGTPDGNIHNEFMDANGNQLTLTPNKDNNSWHKTYIDYCYHNWCVSQADSLMTYPADMTYEDVKCSHEDHTVLEDMNCVLNVEEIHEKCGGMVPVLKYACELDCCLGFCDDPVIFKKLSADDDCVDHDDYFMPPICDGDGFEQTSDAVCPLSDTPIVRLINSSGGADIPDGAPVFYGIKIDSGSDIMDRTVKFRVTNPFDSSADVFVKYDERNDGSAFMNPHCVGMKDTAAGCDPNAPEIEIACHEYQGINPFAIVKVYFASTCLPIDSDSSVDKCCHPDTYSDSIGVVGYTFEIQCHCPDGTADEL